VVARVSLKTRKHFSHLFRAIYHYLHFVIENVEASKNTSCFLNLSVECPIIKGELGKDQTSQQIHDNNFVNNSGIGVINFFGYVREIFYKKKVSID